MKEKKLFFSHDFDACGDSKIQEMLMDYGASGYGIYWYVIEQLYKENGVLALSSIRRIAYFLHVKEEDVLGVVQAYGLFEIDVELGVFWSESQRKRQAKMADVIEKRRSAANSMHSRNKSKGGDVLNESKDAYEEVHKDSKCDANAKQMQSTSTEDKDKDKDNIYALSKERVSPLPQEEPLKVPKEDPINYKEIVENYNKTCVGYPKVVSITEKRKSKIKVRYEEMGKDGRDPMETISTIFTKMRDSKFLKGDNNRGWMASFDWVFENSSNWVKVFEGNYDERKGASGSMDNKSVNAIWQ